MIRPALYLAAALAIVAGLLAVLTGCVIAPNDGTDTGAQL